MTRVRQVVGKDFPVGVRFLAEEAIKDGYALPDSQRIALRLAQMGVDYISLSDRRQVRGRGAQARLSRSIPTPAIRATAACPVIQYPPLPHVHLAAGIKEYINSKGFRRAGRSRSARSAIPADAERLLAEGKADMIGMARQLLSDPDVGEARSRRRRRGRHRALHLLQRLQAARREFQAVSCFLWPKGFTQAPVEDLSKDAPQWPAGGAGLKATLDKGTVKLSWARASGDIAGYDIFRAEADGTATVVEAVKSVKYTDKLALGGVGYTYHVMAYDGTGCHSAPSNVVRVDPAIPAFDEAEPVHG